MLKTKSKHQFSKLIDFYTNNHSKINISIKDELGKTELELPDSGVNNINVNNSKQINSPVTNKNMSLQ